jgi:hypothetical protein
MVNIEVKEILRKEPFLQIKELVTYEAIINSKDEAYVEHVVKDSIIRQLAEHIYKVLELTKTDTHNGLEYKAETYFFTRTQLLRLADECYHAGFHQRNSMHSDFTTPLSI